MDSIHSKYVVSCDLKGTTPDILHITEAAYFQNDETLKESINALSPHGICVVETTDHGVGNFFEQTFTESWLAHKLGGGSAVAADLQSMVHGPDEPRPDH